MNQIFLFSLFCLNVCQIFGMRHNYQQTRKFRQLVAQIKAEKNNALIEFLNSLTNPIPQVHVFKKKVKSLVLDGADPNCATRCGMTALMLAARCGAADLVRFLLQNRANPNLIDVQKKNALMHALDKGNKAILKLLIESKSDILQCDTFGNDALRYAIEYEHPYIANVFIILGADPEIKINNQNAYEFTASIANNRSRYDPLQRARVSPFLNDFGPDSKSKIA